MSDPPTYEQNGRFDDGFRRDDDNMMFDLEHPLDLSFKHEEVIKKRLPSADGFGSASENYNGSLRVPHMEEDFKSSSSILSSDESIYQQINKFQQHTGGSGGDREFADTESMKMSHKYKRSQLLQ